MSLSLSSLLNPSPDADNHASPPQQPLAGAGQDGQSSEQPHEAHPDQQQEQQRYAYPPSTEQDAVQALATLHGSTAPTPTQSSSWYSHYSPDHAYPHRSNSSDHRPGSSGIQLPPPPLANERKMSSPTLDQYHVASRSPDQRRASMISSDHANFTLPPIQGFNQSHTDHAVRPSSSHAHAHAGPAPSPLSSEAPASSSIHQHTYHQHDQTAEATRKPPSAPLPVTTSSVTGEAEEANSSPAVIKQETLTTPRGSSPVEPQSTPAKPQDPDAQSLKTVTSLKNEHGLRTNSPLRESSVPMPSTEMATPEPTVPKKRPAPSKAKKGTATTAKKAPASKKRKIEPARSVTPSSRASKAPTFKSASGKGTPANSSPAPSTRSQSAEGEPYDEDIDEGPAGSDDELYCICHKPDNGTFMIGCDGTCDDWFHGRCVGIEERDKNLIDKYMCPGCTKAGVGMTTWKRICRRSGCRQPARIGKTKGGKDSSKYCSDECGVLFFREMVSRTRGREDTAKHRSSRKKSGFASGQRTNADDDLGARGGLISAGELKSLVNTSKSADDFKKLGEGVLSPPATPDSKSGGTKKDSGGEFTELETKAVNEIAQQKDAARRKHQLLKDRMKFVTMVKQAASRRATERELKPKEYCGYDSRIEWPAEQFAEWRNSPKGKQAFNLETLATEPSTVKPSNDENAMDTTGDDEHEHEDFEVCDRKKCSRHSEWAKLAVDDLRFEMGDNSDRMRALDKEEKEIRERAVLRGKAGSLAGEGSVEVHGLGVSVDAAPVETVEQAGEAMEVDGTA